MKEMLDHLSLTIDAARRRRDQWALILQWSVIAGVGLIVAPLAFTLLAAVTALVLTGCIGLVAVAFAPVAAMKLANWKLSAMLREAGENPIATLENELLQRKAALRQAREHLKTGLVQVEGFVAQAEKAAQQYPEMAERWIDRSRRARALAEVRSHSYIQAMKTLEEFEREVDRSRTEWKLAVAEAAMNDSINATLGDPMSTLVARTALGAVTERMNAAFAGLQIALLEEDAAHSQSADSVPKRPPPSRRIERLSGE